MSPVGATLRDWLSPADFAAEIDAIAAEHGDRAIESPRLGFYCDAWVGLRCAQATGALQLRLGADPPDVELGYADGLIVPLEVVEVLRAGRRRGDEIRQDRAKAAAGKSTLRCVPGDAWPTAAEVIAALAQQADAKARKGYPADTVLAIYLNVGDWDNERTRIEAGMAAALRDAVRAFSAIWILWHGRFYATDPGGCLQLVDQPARAK